MKREKIPLLGYALLGLLQQVPLSGYGVRKIFSSSPMGSYSDSPGAIYPALQRLEKAGLIRGRVQDSSGLRRKKIYRPSDAGVTALKQWLKGPVTREEVVRGLNELALRLSFMDPVIGEAGTLQFLRVLQNELQAYIPTLWEYFNANRKNIPQSGLLALESGIRGYETFLDLCKNAIITYEKKTKGASS
jgi:DNA-binding PadR family transcriptional regulator